MDAPETTLVQQLAEEVAHLRGQVAQLQARLAERPRTETVGAWRRNQRARNRGSRRSLLKLGGVGVVAAAVSLAATRQAAHAADGSTITAGQTTTATSQTTLQGTSDNTANPLFMVDNSAGTYTATAAFGAPDQPAMWGTGSGSNSAGVFGQSDAGYGVAAASTTGIDVWSIGTGRILQALQNSSGSPTNGTYSAGEQIRDGNGDLWLCVVSGSPGTWKKVATTDTTIILNEPVSATSTTTLSAASGLPTLLFEVDNRNGSGGAIAGYGSANTSPSNGVFGGADLDNSAGIYGASVNGYGVVGYSGSGIDLFAGGSGRIFQFPLFTVGAPTVGTHRKGEQMRDNSGELYLCMADGTPGTWVRVAHLAPGVASGGAICYLTKPTRLLDTRGDSPNAVHNGGGPISAAMHYTLQVASVTNPHDGVSIPSSAVGAIGKVTVVSGDDGSGYVALVPSGSGSPTTGTLPYGADQTLATSFNVGLGGSPGSIDIYVGGTAVDVVIDIFGVVA